MTVFLIGMRINGFRHVRSWWPTFWAMPRMLRELSGDRDSGMLGYRLLFGGPRLIYVVQYWSSHERLLAYASAQDGRHRPAWAAFNRRLREGRGKVGFWHETFVVPAGSYEAVCEHAGLRTRPGRRGRTRRPARGARRAAAGPSDRA